MKVKAVIMIISLSISFFLISICDGAWQKELQVKGEIETGKWEITPDQEAIETTSTAGSDTVFESPSQLVPVPALETESSEKGTAITSDMKSEPSSETEKKSERDSTSETDKDQKQDTVPEDGLEPDPEPDVETETTSHQDSKHEDEPAAEPERASETEPKSGLISPPDSETESDREPSFHK
ncbi:MAG: hypothetical protein ACOX4H_09030 [Bacillota bacterium]|jgi:hypothetical protein|nr:hypothetical protein [Clostridia bacterium]